jgi:signal transduction histidine kinase
MDGETDIDNLPRPPFLERVSARQWVIVDIVLAGLFLAGALIALFVGPDVANSIVAPKWVLGPLFILATVPIAFRRRWPEAALVCIGGAVMVATMMGESLAPEPLLALPFYSVILKYSRRQSLLVLGVLEAFSLIAFVVAAALRPVQGNFTFNIVLIGATWFVGDSVRTRRAYQRGLVNQEKERQRQELARAERAVVEERMEIARELHDVIAHSLSVIAIQSGVGRHVIDRQPDEAKTALTAIEETSRSALQELRRVLGVLRRGNQGGPELNPAPTLSDLSNLVDRIRSAGVPVDLQFTGGAPSLPQGLELSVYRIVQEALTNVVKHARSAHTWVRIQYGEELLVVTVTNAPLGAGTLVPDVNADSHFEDLPDRHGIIGMKERAATFGGTLSAASLADGGFEVRACLPLRDPA